MEPILGMIVLETQLAQLFQIKSNNFNNNKNVVVI